MNASRILQQLMQQADGDIDESEKVLIEEQIDSLGAEAELQQWVERQLSAPLDATKLAHEAG